MEGVGEMGDLDTKWLAVWDAIKVEVLKVTGLDATNVFQGLDYVPIGDPLVLIGAAEIAPTSTDTGGSYYRMHWPIVIIVEEADFKQGLQDALGWAGKIRQELLDDRSLGGEVENTEDAGYRPNALASLPGFERQHMLFTVRTFVWVDNPV